jgi:hypothetical protein
VLLTNFCRVQTGGDRRAADVHETAAVLGLTTISDVTTSSSKTDSAPAAASELSSTSSTGSNGPNKIATTSAANGDADPELPPPPTEEPGVVPAAGGDAAGEVAPPAKPVRPNDGYQLIDSKTKMDTQLEGLGATRSGAVKMLIERRRGGMSSPSHMRRVASCQSMSHVFTINITDGTWPRAAYVKDFRDFEAGDLIDACDTVNKWYESIIRGVKPGQIHVHFIGCKIRID